MAAELYKKAAEEFFASVPNWIMEIAPIINEFIVYALVEEFFTYAVGRHAKFRLGISARTLVAVCISGSLGLASAEHMNYAVEMFQNSWGIATLASLLRSLFLFPLQLGTSMIIGIGMAERNVKKEQTNYGILEAFLLAVFFHGMYDVILFITPRRNSLEGWSKRGLYGLMSLIVPFVGGLMWICRRRFNEWSQMMGILLLVTKLDKSL